MNFYEAQELFQKINPGKKVDFSFDEKCIRQIECIYTDGSLHVYNHCQYEQLKVQVEDQEPFYVSIQPHRMIITSDQIKKKVYFDDIYFDDEKIQTLKDMQSSDNPDLEKAIQDLSLHSGVDVEYIRAKLL